MKIQCPRCGETEKIKNASDNKEQEVQEYLCLGKCHLDDHLDIFRLHENTYFQYGRIDKKYSWPALVQFLCHEDDLENMRIGKFKPEII